MLSNGQRPDPLNTGCTVATLDSADPLAQFPAEDADDSPETDRTPRFAADDDDFLLSFASETAPAFASTGSLTASYRHRVRALWRILPMTLALTVSCIRVVGLFSWKCGAFLVRATRLASRTTGAAIHIAAPKLKSLGATLLVTSRDAADRLRVYLLPRLASFVRALARLVVRTTVWAVAFIRSLRTGEQRRQQFVPLTGGTVRPGRHSRRVVVQSHPWTYPAGFFVSGVVAGAFLVMVTRIPADHRVAAQGSALQTAPQTAAHLNVGEPPPAPSASVNRPALVEQPVSTNGFAAKTRQAAAQQQRGRQQAARPVAARPQATRRAPAAVPVRTDRDGPQSFVGSISIDSRPAGAVVFLNGRRVGTTPLLMPELPVGSRAVRLTMSGYNTWSQAVQVVADRRTTVSATLEELRR